MQTIGVGIIGFGFMGKAHTYGHLNMPLFYNNLPFQTKLVGVCDPVLSLAQDAKARVGFEFATDDYKALLAREDIDAVHICTPNALHVPILIDAVNAGKHVYVDKPLAVSAQQADEACKALEGKDVIHQMAFHNRFFPASMRARQLIADGALGDILTFRAAYFTAGGANPTGAMGWRQRSTLSGGGAIQDLGSHAIDLLLWLCGLKAERLISETFTPNPVRQDENGNPVQVTEDHSNMILRLENGATGTVEASRLRTGFDDMTRIEIHGTKGAIVLDLTENDYLQFYDNTLPDSPMGGLKGFTSIYAAQRFDAPGGSFPNAKQSIGWLRAHAHCVYSFYNSIYTHTPATPSVFDGAKIQHILDTAYRSAQAHTWLDIE